MSPSSSSGVARLASQLVAAQLVLFVLVLVGMAASSLIPGALTDALAGVAAFAWLIAGPFVGWAAVVASRRERNRMRLVLASLLLAAWAASVAVGLLLHL